MELRPLTGGDFDALYEIARDPLLWEQHPSKERSQLDGFRAWFKDATESGGTLVARERSSGRVVATSRFHYLDRDCSEIEIGWTFIAREHWGGTYNGEMKRLMLRHAFEHYDHVVFKVHSENHRSQKAVSKLGAVLIDTEEDPLGRGTNVVFTLNRRVSLGRELRGVPDRVASALADAPDDALRVRSAPGEWSAIEVAGHLIDKLTIWRDRVERTVREERPTLEPYDQDERVRRAGYQTEELSSVLDALRTAADRFGVTVESLDDAAFARACVHGEYGEITVCGCITLPLASVDEHLEQIRRAIGSA